MHRALYVAELVECIVEFIVGNRMHDNSPDRSPYSLLSRVADYDLRSLRHTSTLFRDPCLNALWHTQVTLVQVLRAFDTMEEMKAKKCLTGSLETTFKSHRPLEINDTCTLIGYLSRIRAISIPSSTSHSPEPHPVISPKHDLSSLLSAGEVVTLLPRLSRLTCSGNCYASQLAWICHTAGSSLVHFELVSSLAPEVLPDAIGDKMVFLTSLTLPTFLLQHSDDPTATHEALCVIFRKAVRLQKLILGTNLDIGEGIWQALAGLPVLVHLDIRSLISRFSLTEKLSFSTTLVALRIEPPRLDYLLTAFQHSSFPFLQEINCIIFRRQQANHAIVDRFIKAVAKSCSANALRKFHLRCSDYWSSADEHELADAVGSKALSHLFCMHDMREFYVDVGWTWDLGDEFIRDLSQAWPELTWLHLDPRGRWMYPLRITFHGLQSLATYCPRLIRLGIIFDTSPLDMPPLLLPPPAERCMLYELNVGPCKLESPGSFARFLSRIFPCLSSIMFYQYDWDKNALEPRDIQQWYQADFILRDMVMRVTDDSVDSLAEVVTHTHL